MTAVRLWFDDEKIQSTITGTHTLVDLKPCRQRIVAGMYGPRALEGDKLFGVETIGAAQLIYVFRVRRQSFTELLYLLV